MMVKYRLLAEKQPWQLWLEEVRGERGSVVFYAPLLIRVRCQHRFNLRPRMQMQN
jgi:hypothetical protein